MAVAAAKSDIILPDKEEQYKEMRKVHEFKISHSTWTRGVFAHWQGVSFQQYRDQIAADLGASPFRKVARYGYYNPLAWIFEILQPYSSDDYAPIAQALETRVPRNYHLPVFA
ncbi:MAG: hypothetical protein CYPHOPRED_003679 [Cyphobasidiales sp. Tagirdzhanova-0007]|nr:MAG: hypothetical protein CYPHOPRED_003679 [Cyphobasidiales sp. Tagirdzhanova-0007]